jgi:hypothetical protein
LLADNKSIGSAPARAHAPHKRVTDTPCSLRCNTAGQGTPMKLLHDRAAALSRIAEHDACAD